MPAPRKGRYHPGNTLNDLTGSEWLTFTRTWFQADSRRYYVNKDTELHPARYPEEMVEPFIRYFTKAGGWVLDPFCGSGATLISCLESGRHGVGIEVNERYAATAAGRLPAAETTATVICGDSARVAEPGFWAPALAAGCPQVDGRPQFDYIMTSPPYWNMLRTTRGNVFSSQQERAAKGLDTHYSEHEADLGNLTDYETFVETLGGIFDQLHELLAPGRYLVVVVQNLRTPDGVVKPLAWDLGRRISQRFLFQGEKIWCQNTKRLGIWGYPKVFVPNYHHHYCLIFRRAAPQATSAPGRGRQAKRAG